MTLPYDIARCLGIKGFAPCETCRRRELGRPGYQVFCAPVSAQLTENSCQLHIPKEEQCAPTTV